MHDTNLDIIPWIEAEPTRSCDAGAGCHKSNPGSTSGSHCPVALVVRRTSKPRAGVGHKHMPLGPLYPRLPRQDSPYSSTCPLASGQSSNCGKSSSRAFVGGVYADEEYDEKPLGACISYCPWHGLAQSWYSTAPGPHRVAVVVSTTASLL